MFTNLLRKSRWECPFEPDDPFNGPNGSLIDPERWDTFKTHPSIQCDIQSNALKVQGDYNQQVIITNRGKFSGDFSLQLYQLQIQSHTVIRRLMFIEVENSENNYWMRYLSGYEPIGVLNGFVEKYDGVESEPFREADDKYRWGYVKFVRIGSEVTVYYSEDNFFWDVMAVMSNFGGGDVIFRFGTTQNTITDVFWRFDSFQLNEGVQNCE